MTGITTIVDQILGQSCIPRSARPTPTEQPARYSRISTSAVLAALVPGEWMDSAEVAARVGASRSAVIYHLARLVLDGHVQATRATGRYARKQYRRTCEEGRDLG